MLTISRAFWAPKEGNTPEQYEDAFRFSPPQDGVPLTIAASDGASSAGYAREWANRLVDAFATDDPFPEKDAFFHKITALGSEWRGAVSGSATSWYAQEKLESGSAATLLLARIDTQANQLTTMCVGDVCLFLVRKDKLRFGFPVAKSRGFSNRPDLLSTEDLGTRKQPNIFRFNTTIETGDRFYVFTDALAQWFLTRFETRRERPWHSLPRTQEEMEPWLKQKRDSGEMKNDDVTLIEILYEK